MSTLLRRDSDAGTGRDEEGGTMATRLAMAAVALAMLIGLAGPAAAWGNGEDRERCNAGNGSGTEPENDCDPGNSGGNNNGGD